MNRRSILTVSAIAVLGLAVLPSSAVAQQKEVSGYVRADLFFNKTTANSIAGIRADPRFPNNPTEVRYLKFWEFPSGGDDGTAPPGDVYNNYGTRLTGLLVQSDGGLYLLHRFR